MESIYLQGSEDVREASNTMLAAANRMVHAVNTHDSSLTAFMQFMNDWMFRLEAVVEKLEKNNGKENPQAVSPVHSNGVQEASAADAGSTAPIVNA